MLREGRTASSGGIPSIAEGAWRHMDPLLHGVFFLGFAEGEFLVLFLQSFSMGEASSGIWFCPIACNSW